MKEAIYATPEELTARWRVTWPHIRNLIESGKLKAIRLGSKRAIRIPVSEIKRFEKEAVIGS